jgi:hypothetical protein
MSKPRIASREPTIGRSWGNGRCRRGAEEYGRGEQNWFHFRYLISDATMCDVEKVDTMGVKTTGVVGNITALAEIVTPPGPIFTSFLTGATGLEQDSSDFQRDKGEA